MTPITAPTGAFARHRLALAAVALGALALTGCGSDGSGGGGTQSEPGRSAEVSATTPTGEQAAFEAMLDKVAQPCSTTDEAPSGPGDQAPSGPGDESPTGPAGEQSLAPGETPPDEPIEPGAPSEPAPQLSDRDRCASVQHEQRIIEALQSVPDPTPAKVRKSLNGLGYIDERIHGLKQDGRTTRFHLDLREKGGRLCEAGVAAGQQTDVTPCVAPAAGAFTVNTPEGV
ncbi:hypothetical protein ABZY20_03870 [Streptomyces sp. NPDC006624]|uniref:hypothetical protein n=1 Tax=Streptomyces sp. NPDC006624 TaxID=3154892 RepID=UPI0033BBFFD7